MPALFGVFGVVIVFVTAWKLFSRRAAWWSAAVLASNPLYFLASQYADMNIEVAVLITAALCLFLLARNAVERRARRYLFRAAWLAIGLAILTKGLIGIVFPAMIVGAWTVAGNRWKELRSWHFFTGALLVLAVCLPWFVLVQRQNPQFFHYFFIYQQFERFSGHGFNNESPFWFYLPVIAAGLLPWSIWLPSALRRQWLLAQQNKPGSDVYQFLLLWPLLILLFFSIPASKVVGYILPVIPPLALAIGVFLADRREFSAEQSIGAARVRSLRERFFSIRTAVWMPAIGAVICLAAIAGATHFDRAGVAPLAKQIQHLAAPRDRIVSYRQYYQDLPLYLQTSRPLLVVDDWNDPQIMEEDNWRREFYIGLNNHNGAQQDAHQWLIDENRFAAMLNEPTRTFVLARARDERELVRRYGLRVAARTGKNILMVHDGVAQEG
jgi:4-amino-4-deoxy-L-arabinose transferase-like glycosyltransferase